ncbi:acetylcholine-binding protein-like [Aplysia californica]|uniref:Acetylcholine-binding protein-like n=1 Tax=Aplysia californica TaxID=6500 RepID=A0ABM1VWS1_APLCA|nr:acetylcholine-binding protein-like [Aplysia californica]
MKRKTAPEYSILSFKHYQKQLIFFNFNLFSSSSPPGASSASRYNELYNWVSGKASPGFPQPDDSGPLDVDMRLTKLDVVDVDSANNLVTLIARRRVLWADRNLAFDEATYNVSCVYAAATNIWTPDSTFYNSASQEHVLNREVIVFAGGELLEIERVQVSINCDLSGVNTYTGATCHLQLGSYGLGNELFHLREPKDNWTFHLESAFNGASPYELLSGDVSKSVEPYASGDPEQFYYDALTFTFSFRRK